MPGAASGGARPLNDHGLAQDFLTPPPLHPPRPSHAAGLPRVRPRPSSASSARRFGSHPENDHRFPQFSRKVCAVAPAGAPKTSGRRPRLREDVPNSGKAPRSLGRCGRSVAGEYERRAATAARPTRPDSLPGRDRSSLIAQRPGFTQSEENGVTTAINSDHAPTAPSIPAGRFGRYTLRKW